MLIKREDCCLLVIDVQARLLPAMYDPAQVAGWCRKLLEEASAHRIPVLVSEHYPEGIGNTAESIGDLVARETVMEKIHFSCFAEPSARRRIRAVGKRTLVLAGMEAHVCLGQTALDLLAAGYRVVVSSDATSSQSRLDHQTALHRLARGGGEVVPTASILRMWNDDAAGVSDATHAENVQ